MSRRRNGLPPGFSFSLYRAICLSDAKRKASRDIGVPLTEAGRQRKAGAAIDCCVAIGMPLAGLGLTTFLVLEMIR